MSNPIAVPGTNVPANSLVTPGGAQGVQGVQGPSSVSADANNQAKLGSDSLIYVPDPTPVITSVRLRSFNAVGNPGFSVDQRTVGTAAASGAASIDRWSNSRTSGAGVLSAQQIASSVNVPGTNFCITPTIFRFTVTTQQTTLAAGDLFYTTQTIEGSVLRELINDVYSNSILVRSSVAGLTFGAGLCDSASAYSLTKLCTIPSANTWTLITLPNLPLWTASGSFPITPGSIGALYRICFASGSTYMNSANDTWQAGNKFGAVGQSNFLASAVNSTFDLAFIQLEPGAVCTTLIDKPFDQSLSECQRYYYKSYSYSDKPGTVTNNSMVNFYSIASGHAFTHVPFKRTMAKIPTLTGYNPASGAANSVRDFSASLDRSISGVQTAGDSCFGGFVLSTVNAATASYGFHYTADTGW